MSKWIPTKERNPDKSGEYLICIKINIHSYYLVCNYSNKYDLWNVFDNLRYNENIGNPQEYAYKNVVAWQEIEPYVEEENEEETKEK